jgi:uncharacterized membrane protein YfcA
MTEIALLDNSYIIGVMIFFCIVQSVFGMGLLIFGTPSLILLDVPFFDALLILLPASLTISLLQIGSPEYFRQIDFGRSIPLLACAVIIGLSIHLLPVGPLRLEGLLGAVLFCYGLSRISSRIGAVATRFVRGRTLTMTAAMGILHGVSNMGGAILAIISSARFSEKNQLRSFVAANYSILAGIQLVVLLIVLDHWPMASVVASSAIALIAFLCLGHRVSSAISSHAFRHLFTGFIFMYSLALLWKHLQYAAGA